MLLLTGARYVLGFADGDEQPKGSQVEISHGWIVGVGIPIWNDGDLKRSLLVVFGTA
jgi:hypothetical protein